MRVGRPRGWPERDGSVGLGWFGFGCEAKRECEAGVVCDRVMSCGFNSRFSNYDKLYYDPYMIHVARTSLCYYPKQNT